MSNLLQPSTVTCKGIFLAMLLASPAFAQDTGSSPAATAAVSGGMPTEAEMMKQMMEMQKLNENHKLLADLAGTWDYTVKFWMMPGGSPTESKGTATRKAIMEGRFFVMDVGGKMKMPGADGKMVEMDFKGTSTEGYDNVKKKFVGTWADNMGTGIMYSEGDYDPATKTFTYASEVEMMPGMKTKVRETVK